MPTYDVLLCHFRKPFTCVDLQLHTLISYAFWCSPAVTVIQYGGHTQHGTLEVTSAVESEAATSISTRKSVMTSYQAHNGA